MIVWQRFHYDWLMPSRFKNAIFVFPKGPSVPMTILKEFVFFGLSILFAILLQVGISRLEERIDANSHSNDRPMEMSR
ncbi:hypothetical protein BH10PLA1_BH10PLA1_09610 [soil metagenome]